MSRNLIGPVLGGLLADPVALYPSLFPSNSVWNSYRFLLPNLVVGLLQIVTLLLTFFFLRETHLQFGRRHDPGLAIMRSVSKYIKGNTASDPVYAPLPSDAAYQESPENLAELHQLDDLEEQTRSMKAAPSRTFTNQVALQILAVSLLACHKVSSDALMGTFLSLAPSSSDKSSTGTTGQHASFPHTSGGFGLDSRAIGIILLTEAIFRVAIQPTLIPWFISKLGALKAFRVVLGLYPAMYLLTPFLPSLPTPLGLVALLPDLWIKVALSAVGYVCSAVL